MRYFTNVLWPLDEAIESIYRKVDGLWQSSLDDRKLYVAEDRTYDHPRTPNPTAFSQLNRTIESDSILNP